MTTRIRHTFVCENCENENVCDLQEKTGTIPTSCSVCSEQAGEWTRGEWVLESAEPVKLDNVGVPLGRVPRDVLEGMG